MTDTEKYSIIKCNRCQYETRVPCLLISFETKTIDKEEMDFVVWMHMIDSHGDIVDEWRNQTIDYNNRHPGENYQVYFRYNIDS